MTGQARGATFEGMRKLAKRWLKAIRTGDGAALERLRKALPRHAPEPTLREVQHALAREHGFESWAALKEHFELSAVGERGQGALVEELLERACIFSADAPDFPSKWRRAGRILERHPEVATASIHTAALCGEIEHVRRLLDEDRSLTAKKGGKQQWEPLLYACYGRLPTERAAANTFEVAKLLLERGADANAHFLTGDAPYRFTALTGAMGQGEMGQPEHPRAEELARLLLDHGANPNDSQGLYDTHLSDDDTKWLALLFEYGLSKDDLANWRKSGEELRMLDYLAAQAAGKGHTQRLRLLLTHGANPNCRSMYTGKSAYLMAQLAAQSQVAELLLEYGAEPDAPTGKDAFLIACVRGDEDAARELIADHPEYLECSDEFIEAVGADQRAAVRLLLELGLDPSRPGKHGHLALNSASSIEVAKLLIAHGADPRARVYGGTPAGWALHGDKLELARSHAENSRSLLDAVITGHVGLARELLAADPACVGERSPLGNGPLHHLQQEAEVAQQLIELLLAHGADPRAKNDAGKTPAQKLEEDGLDEISDLLESAISDSG